MPNALERKYPNAAKAWRWQYVFPATRLSTDPRSGSVRRHHGQEQAIQRAVKQAVRDVDLTKAATPHTFRHSFATHCKRPARPSIPSFSPVILHLPMHQETATIHQYDYSAKPAVFLKYLLARPQGLIHSVSRCPASSE